MKIAPPICEKFMEKNKCIHTNGMLENELCIYTKIPNLMW